MADHFLTKSQVALADCLPWGAGLALEAHGALQAVIAARVSPEVAALFAEPLLSRGNDAAPASIAWYCDYEGEALPLSALDEASQQKVGALLSQRLAALRDLLSDSEDGTLIGAALHLAGAPGGDIWVVRGQPVLVNWGMLPAGLGRDPASRLQHFTRGLGRFLPLSKAPPLTEDERRARAESRAAESLAQAGRLAAVPVPPPPPPPPPAAPPAMAAAAVAAPPPPPPTMPPTTQAPPDAKDPAPRRISAWEWLPLLLLLLLAGAAVIWLLLPGNRLFPRAPTAVVDDARAAEIVAEINASLIARRDALQAALAGAQCRADGTLILPGGRTIEGLLPPVPGNPGDAPGQRTQGLPQSILPPDPARVQVPDRSQTEPGSTAINSASLLEVIEARTVMVLSQGPDGAATGSGFFIAPDLVLTNFHVIAGAAADGLFVTNASLQGLHPAQLLQADGPFDQTGSDFALLKVPGVSARHFALSVPQGSLKLQSVIAAGYPGDVLATDTAFSALRSGDASAVPDLTVTDGTVSTEQTVAPQTRAVVHSAPISQGNSGGPLVDMCGRVVGMNTFVRQGNLRNLNFALSAQDLVDFLRQAGVSASVSDAACAPEVLRPGVAMAPDVAPDAAPDAGPDAGPNPAPGLPNFGSPNRAPGAAGAAQP